MNLIFSTIVFTLFLNHGFSLNLNADPEIFMNTTQIIRHQGYPCEDYVVTTSDGYILSLQRIPYGKLNRTSINRPVVFLQHGLLDSSFTWVNNLPNQSLGFILADAGYDVWLANSRGNDYSNKHVNYSTDSSKFWDFSSDEMAHYDLPTSINFVLKVTGRSKLSYIGHSQGTLIGFIKFFSDKDTELLRSKISSFTALAPVVYLGHLQSAIKYLASISGGVKLIFDLFNHGEFLPSGKITDLLAELICGKKYTKEICTHIIFSLCGYDPQNLNMSRLPVYISHTPAGTSVKNMVHYAQGYESDKFQYYDYGFIENYIHYNQFKVPQYNLTYHSKTAKVPPPPLDIYWGGNDWLADPSDVSRALRILSANYYTEATYVEKFNHMDFIWGKDAANVIYKSVIKFIRKYN